MDLLVITANKTLLPNHPEVISAQGTESKTIGRETQNIQPQDGASTLRTLPPEMRVKIFQNAVEMRLGIVLVAAVRPDPVLYAEALDVLYTTGIFKLSTRNEVTRKNMSPNAWSTIQSLEITLPLTLLPFPKSLLGAKVRALTIDFTSDFLGSSSKYRLSKLIDIAVFWLPPLNSVTELCVKTTDPHEQKRRIVRIKRGREALNAGLGSEPEIAADSTGTVYTWKAGENKVLGWDEAAVDPETSEWLQWMNE